MNPKVSVRIVTYNHERFIAQALDSALAQKINFPYEIVIGEDNSSDNTRKIVQDYQRRHPEIIRSFLNDRNIGARANTHNMRQECRGEYIAFLDGDDYWTAEHKLQKQADFLDQHPECTICFHNAQMVFDNGRKAQVYHKEPLKTIMEAEDILPSNIMPSCSMMFRNNIFKTIPHEFAHVPFGDWPIQICLIKKGKACYIDEIMGAHRFHSGGMWTEGGKEDPEVKIRQIQAFLLFYQAADVYLEHKYKDLIARLITVKKKELRSVQIEPLKQRIRDLFPSLYKTFRTLKGTAR